MERTVKYLWEIPAVPPSYNKHTRMHWAKQQRVRERFEATAWPLLYQVGNVLERPLPLPVTLKAIISFPMERRRDKDNYSMPLWKWIQDLLVVRGFIPDDNSEIITSLPPKIVPGARPMTIIIIEAGEGDETRTPLGHTTR